MLLDENGTENGKPVRENDKERVQPFFEVACADDSEDDVDDAAYYDDDDTRYCLCVGV